MSPSTITPEQIDRSTSNLSSSTAAPRKSFHRKQISTDIAQRYNSETSPQLELGSTVFPSTEYIPGPFPLDEEDYPSHLTEPLSAHAYRKSVSAAAFKFPPLLTRVSTVSTGSSRSTSPSRSSRPTTPNQTSHSSASTAPTRARGHVPTKSLLNNFFSTYGSPGPEEYPEPEDFDSSNSEMDSPTSSYTCSPRRPRQSSSASAIGGKISWLTSRALSGITSSATRAAPAASRGSFPSGHCDNDDPLLTLDTHAALFPHGPADPLAPSSYHDLLSNAESLISWLHSAYISKSTAMKDLQAEVAIQREEYEESETRARHLKTQLENMGAKVAEQERALGAKMEEERRQRIEAENLLQQERMGGTRWKDTGSGSAHSDSGFESEIDSDGSASAGASPVLGPQSRESLDYERGLARTGASRRPRYMELTPQKSFARQPLAYGGADLRSENQRLRMRVAELEEAVEGCLEMVSFGT